MSIVLQSTGGGSVTIQEPATASNLTANLPAATGTVMVSGNMPAFSAYASGSTSFTINTATKVAFQTKEFDTNSCYDNVTNYRFTPTVFGYYQFTSCVALTNSTVGQLIFYKNGSAFKYVQINSTNQQTGGTVLISMNGSTDYIEVYAFLSSSGNSSVALQTQTYFQAVMVRAA